MPIRATTARVIDPAAQRAVLVLGIGTAILLGDSTLYTVLRADIAARAGVTLAMVGILLGANRAIRLVTNGVAGVVTDPFPRRPLLIGSLFCDALSTLIFAIGRGPAPLDFLAASMGRFVVGHLGGWQRSRAGPVDVRESGPASRAIPDVVFVGTGGAALAGGVRLT